MTTVMAVHSHLGGTGKSHLTVNLAAILVRCGKKVCLVDTNVQAPSLHVLVGLDEADVRVSLLEYLAGRCEIEDTVHDVTDRVEPGARGRLLLVPGRLDPALIAEIVGQGYDAGLFDEALSALLDRLGADVMLLDTHAGMTNETMISLATADHVLLLTRASDQDYRGAQVVIAVIRRLNRPRVTLVVNMLPSGQDPAEVRRRAGEVYDFEVASVIPYSSDVARFVSGDLLSVHHPDHDVVGHYAEVVEHAFEVSITSSGLR